MPKDPDVIVIGAGAAGLSASVMLASTGLSVTILDARDRIGGRIFTQHDDRFHAPIELGAEFIHGRPPEIWKLLKAGNIRITEVDGDNWCVQNGQLSPCDFFSEVDQILKKIPARKRDQSFQESLEECCSKSDDNSRLQQAKRWATSYVSGFNAADPALVGVHWLVKEMRAEEKIEGDRAFRAQRGYADLIQILLRQTKKAGVSIRNNSVVESVRWRPGNVEIKARTPSEATTLTAPRALITVPLGVLQAAADENGAIIFVPNLPQKKHSAIRNIVMGKVVRITLRFRERFWQDLPRARKKGSKTMGGLSFLLSHDDWFPTWWTKSPEKQPFLVGWAPFRCAERLSAQSESFIVDQAIRALHRSMGLSVRELETLLEKAYCHDWQNDPFSRGAYSYGRVGGDGAEQALGMPIEKTLFFAGEATDVGGNNGTVHGAIASGHRAATEILDACDVNNRVSEPH